MPRKNGFEVLEWARQQKRLHETSFVMLSNSDQPEDRDRAASLGATAYLVKYPPPEEFQKAFTAHCRAGNGQTGNV
ncbi:MAG: hypothetical protein Q7S40_02790 [Opitutaceae bacterium]|nr:hypothetical protein [Opitutaceae bacterium]